jgi:hypothetical protein
MLLVNKCSRFSSCSSFFQCIYRMFQSQKWEGSSICPGILGVAVAWFGRRRLLCPEIPKWGQAACLATLRKHRYGSTFKPFLSDRTVYPVTFSIHAEDYGAERSRRLLWSFLSTRCWSCHIFLHFDSSIPFQGESLESSHANASLSEFPVRDGPKRRSTAVASNKNSTTGSHCASPELALVHPSL